MARRVVFAKSNGKKVIEFLSQYIAVHGIPKRIRTDPGTVFKSEKYKQFCEERFMKHVMCPVREHRGNRKVEKMIRTNNERLRTNDKIVIEKNKHGISGILFAFRTEKGADGKSAFEKQTGRKTNTPKSAMIQKCILDKDPLIEIETEDFSDEADSTILVRDRMRGTKLERAFRKVKGKVVVKSEHTVSVLPKSGKVVTMSKRYSSGERTRRRTALQLLMAQTQRSEKRNLQTNKPARKEQMSGKCQKWVKRQN